MKNQKQLETNDRRSLPPSEEDHTEHHIEVGEFLKSLIFGGLDGTINILTFIMSSVLMRMKFDEILTMGISVTLGDAVCMGLGDYMSFKSEQAYVHSEREREEYEFQYMKQEEIEEMEQLLGEFDYSVEDCKRLTHLYSTNKQVFINLMMLTELGLVTNNIQPWRIGLINFIAFLIFGLMPLIPCLFYLHEMSSPGGGFLSGLIGVFQLFGLGYMKAYIIGADFDKKSASGLEILFFGSVVIVIGTCAGSLFDQ